MDATFASYQARLDSFAAPKSKSRRTSTRSKKAAPKAAQKAGWPLAAPRPEDLAYAGFIFKPTSASPDNVQCFSCLTQLDGWEETDTPAFEHLTHSPNCGFAINVCIRLRSNDPGRTEDDPLSETMLEARRRTFADLWPLDAEAGYPSVEQMINAGWYYDPSFDMPDGVSCPYCSLALDAWDAGDDPMEEHRKRSADCLFFTLKEFYHPTQKPKPTRGKRSSSRSSTSSQKGAKSTRTKKAAAKKDLSKPLPPTPDEALTEAFAESFAESVSVASGPAKAPSKGRKTRKATLDEAPTEVFAESFADSVASGPTKAAAKGRKTTKKVSKRISTASVASTTRGTRRNKPTTDDMDVDVPVAPATRNTRTNKRTSDHLDVEDQPKASAKRARISDFSSGLPELALESTPRMKTPQPEIRSPQAAQAAPQAVAAAIDFASARTPEGSPKVAPAHTQVRTPEAQTAEKTKSNWDPINIDGFFEKRQDVFGIISNVMVDSGLDKENIDVEMGGTTEALAGAVKAGLTSPEKNMTIEEWVMYNAKRGEEKLRTECERQISAFEAEGRRALATLDAVPAL